MSTLTTLKTMKFDNFCFKVNKFWHKCIFCFNAIKLAESICHRGLMNIFYFIFIIIFIKFILRLDFSLWSILPNCQNSFIVYFIKTATCAPLINVLVISTLKCKYVIILLRQFCTQNLIQSCFRTNYFEYEMTRF